jgi:hypothetical protein
MRANVVAQYLTNKGNTGLEARRIAPDRFRYSGIWAPRARIVDASRLPSIIAGFLRSHPKHFAEIPYVDN